MEVEREKCAVEMKLLQVRSLGPTSHALVPSAEADVAAASETDQSATGAESAPTAAVAKERCDFVEDFYSARLEELLSELQFNRSKAAYFQAEVPPCVASVATLGCCRGCTATPYFPQNTPNF